MSFLLAWCLVITAIVVAAHAQVNCLVNTPSGIIDLSQIPQKSLIVTQRYQGKFSEQIFKFNLCNASSEPPPGAKNCSRESFVGEWSTDRTCEAQFDLLLQQPVYNNTVVTIGYYNEIGFTATVQIRCGSSPLQSYGVVDVSEQLQFTILLASQYACPPQEVNCLVNTGSGIIDLSKIPQKSMVMMQRLPRTFD